MAQNLRNTIFHLATPPLIFAVRCPNCISVLGLNPGCQVTLLLVGANTRVKCCDCLQTVDILDSAGAESVDKYHSWVLDGCKYILIIQMIKVAGLHTYVTSKVD